MKHPELFIVPVFMLTDYFLTLVGVQQRGKRYGTHFAIETYELNPVWQRAVAQQKWLNPKHILLTIITTGLFLLLLESGDMPEPLAQGTVGGLLVYLGVFIGRHLSNLLTFRYMNRRPHEISGQVTMAHALQLSLALYQCVAVLVPLALVAVLSPTPYAVGGLCGVVLALIAHLRWRRKYARKRRALDQPDAGDGGQDALG